MTYTTAPETAPRILGTRRATAPTPTFMGLSSKTRQETRPASPSPSPSVSAKVRTSAAAVSSVKPGTISSSTPRPSRSFSCASSAATSSSFAFSLLSQTLPPPPASSSIQHQQRFSHHCPHQHHHHQQQQQPESTPRHRHRQLSGEPTTSPSAIIHRDLQHHYSLRNHHRQQSHPQPLHGPTATTLAQSPLRRKSNSSLSSLLSSPKSSSHLRSPASRPVSPCPSSPAPSSPSASPRYHINNRSNSISTTLPPLPYFPPLPLSIDVGNIFSESEHLQQASEHPTKNSTELNADTLYGAELHPALMSPTTSSPPVSLSGMVAALSIADANASMPMLGSGEGMEECCSHDSPSGYSSVNNNNSSNSSKNSNTSYADNSRPMFLTPNFHSEGSSVTSESSYLGSRRSSKDSCESTPGTQVDDLVDQMIVPDYANPQDQIDQIERTKVFLMIYRRFMRPRELLEKLIDRFEALGESLDEDTHTNETRLRICFCLYYWLKNHPNDILHRQTRQLVAAFLRDRVALFPCLNDIYVELLPLSSIHYFNTWRFPQPENNGSASIDAGSSQGSSRSRSHSSSSVTVTFADSVSLSATAPTTASTSASSSTISDSDSDSGSLDTNSIGAYPEEDLDEDREWGLADEDEIVTESPAASLPSSSEYNKKSSFYLADGLAPFAHLVSAFNGGSSGNGSSSSARNSVLGFHSKATFPAHHQLPPRDRRSSTGSFATQTLSPCAMETFVAGRRGSASSISSNPGPFTSTTLGFAEGDLTPMQQLQLQLQPIGEIPFINKRSSSQAYRQHRAYSHSQLGSAAPVYQSVATLAPVPVVGTATSAPVSTTNSGSSTPVSSSKMHPAQSPSPAPGSHSHHYPDHLSGAVGVVAKAAMNFKEAMEEKVHPLSHQHHQQQHGGKSSHHQQHHHYAGGLLSSLSPPLDHLSSSSPLNIPFMEIKDKAIAEQLTCVEYGLFKKLKPRDMLRQVWKTKKGSAAFQACIAHFNFISSWVGTMILLPPKAKHRARMMEKFISIAKILRDMGNYNTTMAIIGAMNTSSIHRLVQTRELLQSKEIWNTFKELEQLMSSLRSFSEYRAALRTHATQGGGPSSNQPCIPYLGVHLADLLSISEGNKDFRQDGALHWQKFVLMTDVISMVLSFQQEPGYRIKPDPFISKVITDTHVLDDEEMYTKSVGTEPNKLNHSRSLSKFNFF